jgi:glycosyltransferase involved in cell wall biosynthesis
MRIAQIAPLIERVPPVTYGGTERVVHALTEELVRRGHDVTLFASGDSITSAKLRSVYPRALREARLKDSLYGVAHWSLLSTGLAYAAQDEFDVIHDHVVPFSLPIANLATTPVVATMHGAFSLEARRMFQALRGPNIVTISNAQLFGAADINHAGTVYNGLPMKDYVFSDVPDDYLLYVGRISMEKGVHLAIDVAQALDMPLVIAAKVDVADREYFREYVEPRLSPRIQWIGEVSGEKRNELMSKAKCFLHPVLWREPFGLTLIEAMACGCPVVAFRRGSIPEVIEDGKTGFVVDGVEEMIMAVDSIDSIDRNYCRLYALEQFSEKRMTDGYEEIYRRLTEKKNEH